MQKLAKLQFEKIEKLIYNAISGSAFEGHVYLVGGVVRDAILNRPTNDIDIVVDLPNGGIRLANFLYEKRLSSHPIIFNRFGTAMIQIDHQDLELVMTRKEFYSNNSRKPQVEAGTLANDAIRRDFTINAFYRKVNCSEILDLTGKGLNDLEGKLLRTTNDPELVFAEDPLRMLRAGRFAAQLGFQIEPTAWQAIQKLYSRLQHISTERIRDELNKILLSANPKLGFQLLKNSHLLTFILPDLAKLPPDTWNDLLEKLANSPANLEFRLALLFAPLKDSNITKILDELKYSKLIIKQINYLIENSLILNDSRWQNFTPADWRYWILKWDNKLDKIINFAESISVLPSEQKELTFTQINSKISQTDLPVNPFPLNGHIIKKSFPKIKGKAIGVLLTEGYKIWLENPTADIEVILSRLRNL